MTRVMGMQPQPKEANRAKGRELIQKYRKRAVCLRVWSAGGCFGTGGPTQEAKAEEQTAGMNSWDRASNMWHRREISEPQLCACLADCVTHLVYVRGRGVRIMRSHMPASNSSSGQHTGWGIACPYYGCIVLRVHMLSTAFTIQPTVARTVALKRPRADRLQAPQLTKSIIEELHVGLEHLALNAVDGGLHIIGIQIRCRTVHANL